MFHIDESIIKQRIRDLQREYQSYQTEVQWLSIKKKSFLKKWLKKFKFHRHQLGTVEQTSIINE